MGENNHGVQIQNQLDLLFSSIFFFEFRKKDVFCVDFV